MFLREIVQALERIERNQAVILERLAVSAKNQEIILTSLSDLEKKAADGPGKGPDEWMQQGIDSIMNYQVGKKRGEQG